MLKKIFLNDRITMCVIFLNAVGIFVSEFGFNHPVIFYVDLFASLYFLAEMIVKHQAYGVREYWADGWNKMDGTLVILSLPSLAQMLFNIQGLDMSILLVLRLLRVLRFFRVLHFFPNFSKLVKALRQAMSQCTSVLVSFFVLMVVLGLINCSLFKSLAPDYFGNPFTSIYSVFRLCTIEGWYEIPDTICNAVSSPFWSSMVSLYFCMMLIVIGIIGMSFINSIFVDAMVADNNDAVEEKIDNLTQQVAELKKMLEEKK